MNKIEIRVLNPEVIAESEKMMVCAARLTQKGHTIKNMNDFIELYNKSYSEKTVKGMIALPHPTIQKFGVINIAVVGASRRFLAQITRHQNEIKFMSASLQYSDYSDEMDFVIPYGVLCAKPEVAEHYQKLCIANRDDYKSIVDSLSGDNDSAGYIANQGLRNILIISATPYQFKHIISQRICRRNTDETKYVMLKIWEALYEINPIFFGDCGPFCMNGNCKEGRMSCGKPYNKNWTPTDVINECFPFLNSKEVK